MIVVDASALADALLSPDERGRTARAKLSADPRWTAPSHLKLEVFSVIRGLALAAKIPAAQGEKAVGILEDLTIDSVPVDSLLVSMWQLRHGVSTYDAAYVALAQARELTLVTSDARLASTANAYCRVELTT